MKSRVNLLSEEFKPKLDLVSLNLLVFLIILSCICVVSAYLLTQAKAANAAQELKQTMAQKSQRESNLGKLSEKVAALKPNASLLTKIENKEGEIRQKRQLIKQLNGRDVQKSQGFARLMSELAEQHDPELWLTKIGVGTGKVRFEGQAASASAVPRWISKLGASEFFEETEFASARLFRDDKERLNFILSSDLSQSDEGANE